MLVLLMNIWQVVLIGLTYFNKLIQARVLIKLWLKGRSNERYDSKNNMLSTSPSTQISQHSIVAWSFYHKYTNNLKQYQAVILAFNC